MQWITQYQYMKSPTENPVDPKVAAEVPAEQPKKPSKSSSRQKLIPIEDLDPDAPRSVFLQNNAVKSFYELGFTSPFGFKYANIVSQNTQLKKCTDEKFHLFTWA